MAHAHFMLTTYATDTHLEYAIRISFPRQKWLRRSASMLICTYISRIITEIECVYYAVRAEPYCNFKELTNIVAYLYTSLKYL